MRNGYFGPPCSSVLHLIPVTKEVFSVYLLKAHRSLVGYWKKRKQKDTLQWERGCYVHLKKL